MFSIYGHKVCRVFSSLSILLLVWSAGVHAFAQQKDTHVHVVFKKLHVERQKRGKVGVHYKIAKKSWSMMRARGIKPRLNMYLPRDGTRGYSFAYSTLLKSRKGRILYPKRMRLRGARSVEMELVGFRGPYHIEASSLGSEFAERIRVPVHRHGRLEPRVASAPSTPQPSHTHGPTPHNPNWKAGVIRECRAQTRFDSDFNACVQHGIKIRPVFAQQAVKECGSSTKFSSELKRCLEDARSLVHDPVNTIRACKKFTKFNSDFRSCIQEAKSAKSSLVPVIKVCDEQSKTGSTITACLQKAKMMKFVRPPTIRACGKATRFDSDFVGCLDEATKYRHNPAETISACAGAKVGSALKRCIRQARGRSRRR